MEPVEARLRSIIVTLGQGIPADFDATAHVFRDLGIASTSALELLFEIEDQFEVALPDLAYNECEHLNDLVALLTGLRH